MDGNLNILNEVIRTSPQNIRFYGLNITTLDSLIIVCGYQGPLSNPLYWVWDKSGNIINSVVLDTLTGAMTAITNHNGRLLFGLTNTAFYTRGEINPHDFTVKKIIKDDSAITHSGFHYISDYFLPTGVQSDTVFAYGGKGNKWMTLIKMDSSLEISSVDTFTTRAGISTAVDRGILSASAKNKIFFATGENPKYSPAALKVGLTNSMRLWRINSNGDRLWSVLVNDSSYYLPTKTVATSDGGAVFFSMKYDWRIEPQPKTSLSIIKLDSTGNFVGLTEIEVPYQNLGIEVFPNPFTDKITLAGVEVRKVRTVAIYDVSGKVVREIEKPESLEFDTSSFLPGTYFLQVVLKTGQSGVYKVVRE